MRIDSVTAIRPALGFSDALALRAEARAAETKGHDPASCPHCQAGTVHPSRKAEGARGGGKAEASRGAKAEAAQAEQDVVILRELQKTDREVRAHEQAHLAAAGAHARGGASYEYQTGPDGQRYAVSGEVSIDTSAVPGDPEATLEKARAIQAAATAPARPSSQDRAVAAQAAQLQIQAQFEIAAKAYEGNSRGDSQSLATVLFAFA